MSPKINWGESFPKGELDLKSLSDEEIILLAWDTEYRRKNANENLLLSYQFAGVDLHTGVIESKIYYTDYQREVRLSAKEIIIQALKMLKIPDNEMDGYHIIFVCFYCVAEWAMMRDRTEIAKHLDFLYKTVVTFRSVPIDFINKSGDKCILSFEMGDAKLLVPPSHPTLDKASSLLDAKYHKKELSQSEKEDMLTLLKNDKKRFEEYALHDAEITLRLYIKLQHMLNQINGSESTRYITIGGATVKHFQRFTNKEVFKSQFSRKNEIYQEGLNLASRAYMGGLSSSYYVGEVQGELFLDIDFSSAYPTVMSLLQLGDFGEAIKTQREDPKDFSLGDIT